MYGVSAEKISFNLTILYSDPPKTKAKISVYIIKLVTTTTGRENFNPVNRLVKSVWFIWNSFPVDWKWYIKVNPSNASSTALLPEKTIIMITGTLSVGKIYGARKISQFGIPPFSGFTYPPELWTTILRIPKKALDWKLRSINENAINVLIFLFSHSVIHCLIKP